MGRWLSVDLGTRRVGLAVTDPLKMIASPLKTLVYRGDENLTAELLQIVREMDVERVIVGLPLREDGTEGPGCLRSRQLVGLLEKSGVDARLWDERYTSVAAEDLLREWGQKRKGNVEKIDRMAASILLEDYMRGVQ